MTRFGRREYRLLSLFEKSPKLGDLYLKQKNPTVRNVLELYARGDWDAEKALAELSVHLIEQNEKLMNDLISVNMRTVPEHLLENFLEWIKTNG